MKEVLIKEYNNLKNLRIQPKKDDFLYNIHFVEGAFCEIRGAEDTEFRIEFIDKKMVNSCIIMISVIICGLELILDILLII